MRLWVEISGREDWFAVRIRQPLREAVSWNVTGKYVCASADSSASSWGCELKCYHHIFFMFIKCQPLREAVSWNNSECRCNLQSSVSLFVRLWVEMLARPKASSTQLSASSWGCELKYHISQPWKCSSHVSLFVRLWVEMYCSGSKLIVVLSASSWGCELKCAERKWHNSKKGQPLREAVSWNTVNKRVEDITAVSLFVRLWVEIAH